MCTGGRATLEHIDDGTDETVAIFDELAIAVEVDGLEEKAKSSLDEDLITIETEGEAQLAFVKELDNLDDVLACITDSNDSCRCFVAKIIGDDGWAVNQ